MTDIEKVHPFLSGGIKPQDLMSSKKSLNPAMWMYERLVKSIIAFEEKLDSEHEIGARLVNFGHVEVIHIEDLGYWGPDIIKFYGTNHDGQPVELIQHTTQLSVLLVALKKEAKQARRIGYDLSQKLEAQ